VVGGCPAARQPPLTPPYQGGDSFSWFLGARQPTGMSDYSEVSDLLVTRRSSLVTAFCLLALNWLVAPSSAKPQEKTGANPASTAAAHLGKGYELVKDERYREAAAEFQAALALQPSHVRARYQLAVCWFALLKLPEARTEFERVRQEAGEDAQVVYYLGRIDLLEGDTESAIRKLRNIAARPPFTDTAYYLGSAYLQKGNLQEAEKWLRTAAAANPRDYRVRDHLARVYQKQGHRAKAESEYNLASQLRTSADAATRAAVVCGQELESHGLSEASETCRQLLDSRDPDKLTTLGLLYGRHGFFAEALEPLEQAARLDPDSSEIQHDLGLTYFRLRRYKEARAPLEKAVAIRPDFFGSCALLGATLYSLGEHELSYTALRHAHQLNPQDEDTASLLFSDAVVLAQSEFKDKEYEKCLAHLQVAAELRSADPQVHWRLADVYGLLGRRAEADRERADAERLGKATAP
jgi:tetratricopeptide (TPR) repeat protein